MKRHYLIFLLMIPIFFTQCKKDVSLPDGLLDNASDKPGITVLSMSMDTSYTFSDDYLDLYSIKCKTNMDYSMKSGSNARFDLKFYVSSDKVLSANDQFLYQTSISLSADQIFTGKDKEFDISLSGIDYTELNLPSTGTYYIIAKVVFANDEGTGNNIAYKRITIAPNPYGDGNGRLSVYLRESIMNEAISVYVDGVYKGMITQPGGLFCSYACECSVALDIDLPPGTYNISCFQIVSGGGWSNLIKTVTEGNCTPINLIY
jgi:hypothetical protein